MQDQCPFSQVLRQQPKFAKQWTAKETFEIGIVQEFADEPLGRRYKGFIVWSIWSNGVRYLVGLKNKFREKSLPSMGKTGLLACFRTCMNTRALPVSFLDSRWCLAASDNTLFKRTDDTSSNTPSVAR